nr:hypothetical protein [Bacteroidota bacterium]
LLVQGRPGVHSERKHQNITIMPHLDSARMMNELEGADLIVSRSGYTTIMDLVATGKRALLIPTPGQPEQEYLARLHAGGDRFVFQDQDHVDLAKALLPSVGIDDVPIFDHGPLDRALHELATMIR